jgi:deoxyadenosine/deoxycytidine kinase
MPLTRYRHIVVEGPIGAGKTTLARRLAERLHADLLLEDPDANPFLPRFYDDARRWALPTQLFFLFQRFDQLRAMAQHDLFRRAHVADFLLEKDPLFASLTLEADELALYRRLYDTLAPRAPRPDLVVYVQAPAHVLAERVRRRGVDYERGIEEDYLARLADAYANFFHHYDEAPVLAVNSAHLDFAASDEHLDLLLAQLASMRGRRAYLNVGDLK